MKMKKHFSCDRLSELPDSLILEIFRFLPMTDVVRTTILSKRWKNLWTTVACLDFDNIKMKIATNRFREFVNGAINSWRGIKIVKFIIKFNKSYRSNEVGPSDRDIDSWMQFATEKNVEYLELKTPLKSYVAPQCLLTCSSLQVLYLQPYNLRIHGDLRWDRLKSLTLYAYGLSEDSMNRVLSGSPLLEFLELRVFGLGGKWSIRSSSLKSLILGMYGRRDSLIKDPELRISTPDLKKLEIYGDLYSKCLLMDVSSLTEATYMITKSPYFPTIEHVERVTLSSWCIRMLGAMEKRHILSPSNTKFLKLELCSIKYDQIWGALAKFPKLMYLVIISSITDEPKPVARCAEICPKISPLPQLRTVDVTWKSSGNDIFLLVQKLLTYAINLEKIVLREKKSMWLQPTPSSGASDILRKMERSYPKVEFVLC